MINDLVRGFAYLYGRRVGVVIVLVIYWCAVVHIGDICPLLALHLTWVALQSGARSLFSLMSAGVFYLSLLHLHGVRTPVLLIFFLYHMIILAGVLLFWLIWGLRWFFSFSSMLSRGRNIAWNDYLGYWVEGRRLFRPVPLSRVSRFAPHGRLTTRGDIRPRHASAQVGMPLSALHHRTHAHLL